MDTHPTTVNWASQQAEALQRMREGGGQPGLARPEQLAGRAVGRSWKG